MSDTNPNEPAATMFAGEVRRQGNFLQRMFGKNTSFSVGANFDFKLPGIEEAVGQLGALNAQMEALKTSLSEVANSMAGNRVRDFLKGIGEAAATASNSLSTMNRSLGQLGTGSAAPQTVTAPGQTASVQGGTAGRPAGFNLASMFGAQSTGDMLKDMALFPLRFMKDRIENNRQIALAAQSTLAMQSFATGATPQQMLGGLARFPGQVYGTPQEMLQLFQMSPMLGAMVDFTGLGRQTSRQGAVTNPSAPRAAGFLESLRQMQMMNPGAPVAQMAGTIGSFTANVGAQQQSAMLTGGAFSMASAGGGQKNLQQWSESILRWFEGLRPGNDRGKPFDYGQLMAQYFPGSNIDAWFTANGVPQDMREYWWAYALGKANKTGSTQGKFQITPQESNVAYQRLKAGSELTRTEFGLAGTMSGAYANREQANRWFNQMMGQVVQTVIPTATSTGVLQFMQYMPDTIEEMMMTLMERAVGQSGPVGYAAAGLAGLAGWGNPMAGTNIGGIDLASLLGSAQGVLGQVGGGGDVGDYGTMGGTTTAGLHPDMRRKVNAMMMANPRVRVTSGLRDHAMQQRLHKRGVGRVSGKPSAHTRGMAADLGPPSEYPWIARNAGKFGLTSGIGAGEPWHVGMQGDVGDLTDIIQDLFGGFKGLFEGATGGGMVESMGSLIPMIMSLVFGPMVRGGGVDQSKLAFQPGLLGQLQKASKSFTIGGGIITQPTMPTPAGSGTMPGNLPSAGTMSREDVAKLAAATGFTGSALQTAIAVAEAESHFKVDAHRTDRDRSLLSGDRGLWQINYTHDPDLIAAGVISQKSDLLTDPAKNAAAAWRISGGGTNWSPWTVYKSGAYEEYMDEAKAAMTAAGVGDADFEASYRGVSPRSTVVFQNTFNINGGGSNTGMDVRRTVSVLADHLEAEMKQRMSRMN